MAKLNKDNRVYYSHSVLNKTKRAAFVMVFTIIYAFMVFFVASHLVSSRPWYYVSFPLLLLGIPISMFPTVEDWVYKPWQSKAQKYERHYRD